MNDRKQTTVDGMVKLSTSVQYKNKTEQVVKLEIKLSRVAQLVTQL
jgi:hypothetical protein